MQQRLLKMYFTGKQGFCPLMRNAFIMRHDFGMIVLRIFLPSKRPAVLTDKLGFEKRHW
jgi:hypothetical protein